MNASTGRHTYGVNIPVALFAIGCILSIVCFFFPMTFRSFSHHEMSVGEFITLLIGLTFLAMGGVGILLFKLQVADSELTAFVIRPIRQYDVGDIRYVHKSTFPPFSRYFIGITTRYGTDGIYMPLSVTREREFLRDLHEAGPRIEFSRHLMRKIER